MKFKILILSLLILPLVTWSQVDTVFWFVAPEVTNDHGDEPINLVISNTEDVIGNEVTISMPQQGAFTPITITLNGYETVVEVLTPRKNLIESYTQGLSNKGILIKAESPISAYYEVDRPNNRDIFALKGDNALGEEFYVPAQSIYNNHTNAGWADPARNRIDIVAAEDGTVVEIEITADANGLGTGSLITTPIMSKGETYSIVADDEAAGGHLSGTHITTNGKLIAVTLSDDSVDDPGVSGWDLIGDQLVPINASDGELLIGNNFIVVRTDLSDPENYFIVATNGVTNIDVDGANVNTINTGEIHPQVISGDVDYISCDKPVYLFHVGGTGNEMGGALLPTLDGCKGSLRVSFTRTGDAADDFRLNLLVEADGRDNFQMQYEDGTTFNIPAGNFTQVPNTPVGEDWYYLDLGNNTFADATGGGVPIDEVTTIVNTEKVFQLGLYNNASGGCKYGYFSDFKTNESTAVASGTNTANIQLCYGDSTDLKAYGGVNYQWSSISCPDCIEGDLTASTVKIKPPPGVHDFYVEIDNPCKSEPDTAKITVEVDSLIQAYFTSDKSLTTCDSLYIQPNNNSIGETHGFYWSVDGSFFSTAEEPIIDIKNTGSVPDTVPISLTASRILCSDYFVRTAIIYPAIKADFTPQDTAGCSPFNVPFTNLTTAGTNTYKWNFDDGNLAFTEDTDNTFENTNTTDTVYDVSMIATSEYNCKDTTTKQVTVHPPVTADFFTDKLTGCAPLEINVTNLSSLTTIDSVQWVWGDGDTSFVVSPGSHTYQNTTGSEFYRTLSLEVFSNNGCSDVYVQQILVYPQATAGFDQDLTDICHNEMVTFTDTSTGPITSKKWNFDDGTIYNNVDDTIHIFQNFSSTDSVFTVQQTIQSQHGCKDTASIGINVHPSVRAVFSSSKNSGCADLDISLTDQSLGPITLYEWDWGDGSLINPNPTPGTHTYINNTDNTLSHTIELVVENAAGCTDTMQQSIEIYPKADATFNAAPLSGCNPLDVTFTHNPSNGVAVDLNWEFGDASSASISPVTHTYQHFNNTTTTFDASLSALTAKGCSDTVTTTIDVGPYYNVTFTLDTASGCSPLTINPVNTSTGGIDSWTWKKEDVVISSDQHLGSITLYNNTNTPIDTVLTLIGSNSAGVCEDSIKRTITIYPSVDATIVQDVINGCNPLTVNFSNAESVTGAVWNWDFGDGSSSSQQAPTHVFDNPNNTSTTYTTQLIVSSASKCADTATQDIEVASRLEPDFTRSPATGCSPLTVTLEDVTTGEVTSRTWRKNDILIPATTTTTQITLYNNTDVPIDTTIWLIVENSGPGSCSDSISKTITIYPALDATIVPSVTQGCTPLTVDFTNTEGASNVTWSWTFGDGNTSNLQNPTNEFVNSNYTASTYTTQLVLKSANNCTDTSTQNITVASQIEPEFSVDKSQGCSPLTVQLQDESLGDITSRTWRKEDIQFSTAASPQITLYNTTDAAIDTTIWLIVKNSGPGSCTDSTSKTITIYPSVDPTFAVAPNEGCNPLTVDFTNNETNPDVTWSWQFGDGNTSNLQNPQNTYENETNTAKTYTPKLVVKSNYNCKDSSTQTITVASRLQANFTMDKAAGCSPLTIQLQDASLGEVTSREWTKNGIVFATGSATPIITLYNNTDSPIDTTITLTVTNSGPGTCGSSASRTVTIYPSVDATFTSDVSEGCNPLTVNFSNAETNSEVAWQWDFGDNNSSTEQNPTHTFTNTSTSPVNYDVKLRLATPYGCKDSVTNAITVGQNFNADFSTNALSGCSPFLVQFSNDSEGTNLSYNWYRNGTVFSSSTNPNLTITNTSASVRKDTITLVATTSGSITCYDTIKKVITTYPEVDATFNHAVTEGCNPLEVQFNHDPSLPINVDHYWDFGDNSNSYDAAPSHTFYNDTELPQTYEIKLVVESTNGGCKDSTTSTVEVASRLDANFQLSDAAGCSPFTSTFLDASIGDIASRQWYVDGTPLSTLSQASTTVTNTTNSNLTRNIKLVVTNTGPGVCKDSITRQITSYPEVVADFSLDTARGCNPLTVNFTHEPGDNEVNVNFDWEFGDNTTSDEQDPQHIFEHFNYNGTSSFDITLTTTSEYGCTDQHQENVVVEKALKAEFAIDPSAGCNPFNAGFNNTSKGADTYEWIFGDGDTQNTNILQDINHEYTNASFVNNATYNSKLIVTNTGGVCVDSFQQVITVYPQINASYTASTQEGCHPVEVVFTNTSQGNADYFWDFDDQTNSTQTNPTHTFRNTSNTNDQYFNVQLTATNAYECSNDTTLTIRVNHNPRALFDIDETESCSPLEILATNNSIGASSFEWRMGNGETNENNPLNYTYNNTTGEVLSYKLELFTETNRNCKDSTSLMLNVYPLVNADFNITNPQDCNPLTTSFENLSANADNYYWTFGDGTTSSQFEPTKRFEITGYVNETIPVKLVSSSGYNCTDSLTKSVTVYVQPDADFNATPVLQQFPSNTVTITDLTNGGPFAYNWSFGDGNTSTAINPGAHDYATWGTYNINLNVANQNFDCTDSAMQNITITAPEVTAAFEISDTAGCMPHTATFTAEASQFSDDEYTYFWDFGDGTTSNEQTPTHTYDTAGNYTVILTVIGDNGSVEAYSSVRVYPLPIVNFTMDPRLVMIPDDETQCYNHTQNGETYLWNFGDGTTSEEVSPSHYYTTVGTYDVTLTATSKHGCEASVTRENYIEVKGKGSVEFPNAFTPSIAGPSDGTYSETDTDNDIFHPHLEGVVEYHLYIYNRWGELMFESEDQNIGWDGYYNGKICPQDVYIWRVKGKFINGKTFEKTGDVTLLR